MNNLHSIKYMLHLQALQMILSNFNMYDEEDTKNFEGLNMISTVFSVLFTIFNSVIASLVIQNQIVNLLFSLVVFSSCVGTIMFTNFIWEQMNYHTVISIIICITYMMILVPSFGWITTTIMQESVTEAKLSYAQRDQFRKMFNGLQEGIIVL